MLRTGSSRFYRWLFAIGVGVFFIFSASAQNVRQILSRHVPKEILQLAPNGRLAPAQRLNLAIGLPLQNPDALGQLLNEISDPASPNFRHYLTPQQFAERFGPSKSDYEAVVAFFQKNGFIVETKHPNRVVLDVSGSVVDIERVFHVTMRTYRHPTEARDFFAPDIEPSVDLPAKILHVAGLENFYLPHPNFKPFVFDNATPQLGSGTNSSYRGYDFRGAYLPGVTTNQLSGAGQIVGLLQFDGYYTNDIAKYEDAAGLPHVLLTNIPVRGGVKTISSGGSEEVSLDIEMVVSMAPGVSQIILYEAPNPSPFADLLNRMADDNLATSIGCSWGGGAADPVSEQIFKQMAVQGQTFFNASGDSDAFTGLIPFPSDSTNIVQVGGTTLSTTGPGGARTNEVVWNSGSGIGSGGGISTTYQIPSWQQGIGTTNNKGSATMRNVPDVAMVASKVQVLYGNGKSGVVIGTSIAAPLWAGFTALINQRAAEFGQPPVGFFNPAIYAIGQSANYTNCFYDIISGNNFSSKSPNKFSATTGYDLCTGWGSPAGTSLIDALLIPDALGITPASGFIANGLIGGPFDFTSQTFFLTNAGAASLDWELLNLPDWLDVSQESGTLPANSSAAVTLSLNSNASNLVAGIYTADVTFTNLTSGFAQSRQFTLRAGQSIVGNGGFESDDFGFWTLGGSASLNFVGKTFAHSGIYGAQFGQPNSLATLSQTLSTVAGQNYLLSFWVKNPKAGSALNPEKFIVKWQTNTLLSLKNPRAFSWTNRQFIVTASATSAVLQFQFQNKAAYFGLDDVSVTPIPSPAFTSSIATASAVTFKWNSVPGVKYQLQTSTNLMQWEDLGDAVTADDNSATITIPTSAEQQRFYRIRWLP